MSDTLVLERIDMNLSRLRLPCIREILQRVTQSCEKQGKSYLSFLDELLEEEVAQKEQRRIETALKISGLPSSKVLMSLTSPSIPNWIVSRLCHYLTLPLSGNLNKPQTPKQTPSLYPFPPKAHLGKHPYLDTFFLSDPLTQFPQTNQSRTSTQNGLGKI
jgi:hypothetical protein